LLRAATKFYVLTALESLILYQAFLSYGTSMSFLLTYSKGPSLNSVTDILECLVLIVSSAENS
jgi:hypothetical protein